MPHDASEEIRFRLLRYLEEHPEATQREVATALGVSLGKANYCLRALIDKGWLKVRNFRRNKKAAYLYALTPRGIQEKINLTVAFLRRKRAEYDLLAQEIERLSAEVGRIDTAADPPR